MKGLIFGMFIIGIAATCLLFFYILSMMLYVFSGAGYMGDIAYLPKWIFLFCPLVFLGKTKAVNEVIYRLPL